MGYSCGMNRTKCHPISWCRDYDGGRSFYTGMGHTAAATARRRSAATCRRAEVDHRHRARRLPGHHRRQLQGRAADRREPDRPARPDRRAARPDHRPGRPVFYVGKGACDNERAGRRLDQPRTSARAAARSTYDPATKQVKLLTTLPVMGNRAAAPSWSRTRRACSASCPTRTSPPTAGSTSTGCRTTRSTATSGSGKRTVSRLHLRLRPTIDQAPARTCCPGRCRSTAAATPAAAWRSTTRATCTSAPATTTPPRAQRLLRQQLDRRVPGRLVPGRRRTAGNTNDLNGKIIRIHPEADGTYTIPEGNLFPARTARPARRST
jgi:hypothetical protein